MTPETTTPLDTLDPELDVLQNIYFHADHVRQRDLARIAGLSLGMINAIIKRLVKKGWLTIKKTNNRNIRYIVSPAGIDEITRRSYRFLKRTIRYIVDYREAIEHFAAEVKSEGFHRIVLTGRSEIDFIVEHACQRCGLELVKCDEPVQSAGMQGPGVFLLHTESEARDDGARAARPGQAFLQDIVTGRLAGEATR